MHANVARSIGLLTLCLMMSLISGCSNHPPVIDDLCVSIEPVYMPDAAIEALRPWRDVRRVIAANNKTWESRCAR